MVTHDQIERKIFPIIRRGLRQQIAPVIQAIEERGKEYVGSQLNRLVTVDPVYRAFNDFYPQMLVDVSRSQYRQLEATKDIIPQWIVDAWNTFAATYLLTDIFSRMLSITETNRRRVTRLIQREIEIEEILQRIGARDFVDPHAYVIARTEATTILNTGSEKGAISWGGRMAETNQERNLVIQQILGQQLATVGHPLTAGTVIPGQGIPGIIVPVPGQNIIRMWHRWVPMEDMRTRPAHFAMRDVRPIPLGMRFEVGGELLKYPGDPNGSLRNTVNCRCRQTFFTEQEVAKRYGTDYVNSFMNILQTV